MTSHGFGPRQQAILNTCATQFSEMFNQNEFEKILKPKMNILSYGVVHHLAIQGRKIQHADVRKLVNQKRFQGAVRELIGKLKK